MATINISETLISTDLGSLRAPSDLVDTLRNIQSDLEEFQLDDEPSVSGTTETYKNPHAFGSNYYYTFTGSAVIKYNSDGDVISGSGNFSKFTIDTSEDLDGGLITVNGSLVASQTYNAKADSYKISKSGSISGVSFVGADKSKWSISCSSSVKYSYDSATDKEIISRSETISGFSSSDAAGNGLAYSGKFTYNSNTESYSGFMTSLMFTIGGSKFVLPGLNLTYEDVVENSFQFGTVEDFLPTLLNGNDVITISSSDAPRSGVYGYAGNDKITGNSLDDCIDGGEGNDTIVGMAGGDSLFGGSGNDSLSGGAGSDYISGDEGNDIIDGGSGDDTIEGRLGKDTLAGGAGSDTFLFDFNLDTKNSDADVIADFAPGVDSITLFIGESDRELKLSEFKSGAGLNAAKTEDQRVIYDTSTGKLYYDADGRGGEACVLVVTLVGKPNIKYSDVYFSGE